MKKLSSAGPRFTKDEADLRRKFRKHARHKELGKLHYTKADELLEELLKEVPDMKRAYRMRRDGLQIARFKDNFDGQNTAFRAHGIKRYELEIVNLAPKG